MLRSASLHPWPSPAVQTARNIFEYGLKKYIHEPDYVVQ